MKMKYILFLLLIKENLSLRNDIGLRLGRLNQYEEYGYWENTNFLENKMINIWNDDEINFMDTTRYYKLFTAPKGRSWADFLYEMKKTGRPCFTKNEMEEENIRIRNDGTITNKDGEYLGEKVEDRLYIPIRFIWDC